MANESVKEFRRLTEPIYAAVSESRFEDAMSLAIKGLHEAKFKNDAELLDSLLGVIRGIVIVMENEFGSASYLQNHNPIAGGRGQV